MAMTAVRKRLDKLENQGGETVPEDGSFWLIKGEIYRAEVHDMNKLGRRNLVFVQPDLDVPFRCMKGSELTALLEHVRVHGETLHKR